MSETTKPANRLLAALPAKDYARLLLKLEEIPLTFAKTFYEPGDIIRHVYFPNSGIISLLSAVEERSLVEVGIVGNEGFVGVPVFLGVKTSNNCALVQGAGVALEMKTADFLAECENGGALPRLLQRYTHSLIMQISQSAACNRFHPIEARLARWLLMTSDRMESDEFQITQEFLSNMLGVRREGVSKSATQLQQNELIIAAGKSQSLTVRVWKPLRVVVTSLLKRNMRNRRQRRNFNFYLSGLIFLFTFYLFKFNFNSSDAGVDL